MFYFYLILLYLQICYRYRNHLNHNQTACHKFECDRCTLKSFNTIGFHSVLFFRCDICSQGLSTIDMVYAFRNPTDYVWFAVITCGTLFHQFVHMLMIYLLCVDWVVIMHIQVGYLGFYSLRGRPLINHNSGEVLKHPDRIIKYSFALKCNWRTRENH